MRAWAAFLILLAGCRPQADRPFVFVTDYMDPQTEGIEPLGGRWGTTAHVFGARGEYEPVSFAIQPREPLTGVTIRSGQLLGPEDTIPPSSVRLGSVQPFHGEGRDILGPIPEGWEIPAGTTAHVWITVKIPKDAKAGSYQGQVTIAESGTPLATLDLEVEVLPIRLVEPPYALGYDYSSPRDPEVLAAHLRDMREHGMTVVAPLYDFHLPIDDDDTSELGAFIEAYEAAGFTQPVYFARPMDLSLHALTGYGPFDSRRFQKKYLEIMRRLHAEALEHGHPVVFSIGDEFTNQGAPGIEMAGTLARLTHEELPELATASDINGYEEAMAMAPFVNIVGINHGWDGADGHNRGRRLQNPSTLEELQAEGTIPWFVNMGSGRFPFGLFFWRMARLGVRGKVEWYYSLGGGDPGSIVKAEGTEVFPTLDYERAREGIDDLRYLLALEAALEAAESVPELAEEVAAGRGLLARIAESISPDWSDYQDEPEAGPSVDGFGVTDPRRAARFGELNSLRRELADRILALGRELN